MMGRLITLHGSNRPRQARVAAEVPDRLVHLVGVGGTGLSPLARLALYQDWIVTGSDQRDSPALQDLRAAGARLIASHHDAAHVALLASHPHASERFVVASSAIQHDNVELIAARQWGIQVLKRNEWFARFTRDMRVLAIAGTHGKTTTTALVAYLLWQYRSLLHGDQGALMALVGGRVPQFPSSDGALFIPAHSSSSSMPRLATTDFVIEADEYDYAFLGLSPFGAVVTHLDHDHVDCFPSPSSMLDAFGAFVARIDPSGFLILNGDDDGITNVDRIRSASRARVVTYGWREGNDVRIVPLPSSSWALVHGGGEVLCEFHTRLLGRHNACNVAAALLAAASFLGRGGDASMLASLAAFVPHFHGVEQRCQLIYSSSTPASSSSRSIHVYDDYAHHPTEIQAVMSSVAAQHRTSRLVLVLEPHTFQRLAAFWDDFVTVLVNCGAHEMLILPVYVARAPLSMLQASRDAADLVKALRLANCQATLLPDPDTDKTVNLIVHALRDDAVLVMCGAGRSSALAKRVAERVAARPNLDE